MASPIRLVVGIDFGTTFTGVATACTNMPEDITVVQDWPGSSGLTSEKVPTELSYVKAISEGPEESGVSDDLIQYMDRHFSPKDVVKDVTWGYQIRPQETRIRCIKLFLDKRQKLPGFVSSKEITKSLALANRTVIDAVADYLAKIHQAALFSLVKQYDYAFLTTTPIDFVLTVPAVWSDAAKDATKRAAQQAGLGKGLRLISEPEAAVVYAVKAIQKNGLNIGANIVTCDAGGGTVDLIPYRIKSLEPLAVEESGVGTGGLCGAAFLNYKFEEYVRTVLGEEAFEAMLAKKPKAWQAALNNFETYVKRNLDEENDKDFCIPFPGLINDAIEDGYLTMTTKEVRDIIFEPIISNIISLVDDQVSKIHKQHETVDAIVLVGGFGQSKYLHSRLKAQFSISRQTASSNSRRSSFTSSSSLTHLLNRNEEAISILQPAHAWTAVARGAALRGLQGTIVTERLSRKHYGGLVSFSFNPEKHPEYSKYWDSLDEMFRSKGNMQWFLRKNEQVSEHRAISHKRYLNFKNGEPCVAQIVLYESADDVAPTMRNPTLHKVCSLYVDFSGAPSRLFTHKTNSLGVGYRSLSYTVEMIVDSAGISFSSKVNGDTYGTVTADFDC